MRQKILLIKSYRFNQCSSLNINLGKLLLKKLESVTKISLGMIRIDESKNMNYQNKIIS